MAVRVLAVVPKKTSAEMMAPCLLQERYLQKKKKKRPRKT